MKYSILFLLFPAPLPLAAQTGPDLWFHHLGKDDGLSNSTSIYNVFQDSEGFTWFGSESGLDRFDGHSVVHYGADASDSSSLSGNMIFSRFFEDGRKNLWFCNDVTIQRYDRRFDHFDKYTVRDARGLEISSGYQAICLERDSFLWVRAEGRNVYVFNIHTAQSQGPVCTTSFDIDLFPGITSDGRLRYLFSVDGSKSPGLEVLEFDHSRQLIGAYTTCDGGAPELPALHIHSVLFEHDTSIWLSSDNAIFKMNKTNGRLEEYPTGIRQPKLLTPYDSGRLLVAELNSGLYFFDKREKKYEKVNCRPVGKQDLPINPLVDRPFVDPQGNIWLTLFGNGLVFSDPENSKFRSLPKLPGFDGSVNYSYRTLLQGADKKIWCSTADNGIFLLEPGGRLIRHYHPQNPLSNSLPHRQVFHMMLDSEQGLWAATAIGVFYLDPVSQRFTPVLSQSGKRVPNVTYLFQLKNGDILASTLQLGVFRITRSGNTWRMQEILPPDTENDFYTTIYEDQLGSIYISREMSKITVFTWSGGKLKSLITKEIRGFINGFIEDRDGKTLWIATTYGLVKIDKTALDKPHVLLSNQDGLQYNEIQSFAFGNDQKLWLATTSGISRFDPGSNLFVNFSQADGLQSRQFNSLSVLNRNDGTIWFGGDDGITIVNPATVKLIGNHPRIQITEIRVNDDILAGLKDPSTKNTNVQTFGKLVQKFRDNTLSFTFVAMDYSDPSSTQIRYRMDGFDENWMYPGSGKPGFARYPKLPPGFYTLQIQAANSDGVWSDEIKELSIRIRPPWYRTWWAMSLFAIITAFILYAIYRYRVGQIRKEEAFKRKEAEYKQLVSETETAVLRLQMNPHFIFNSMNSISSYILQKNIDTANDYLNRFARLMRMILKLAEKPFLSISQERELLELYLNTEAMRFEDKIEYEFVLSDNLDPDDTLIPTMILQPFIENAIWHGLAHKKGPKKIAVSFIQNGDRLHCSVEDNGIGMAAAAKLKPQGQTHESKAISITKRRLGLLEEMKGVSTELVITDLLDEAGQAAGTRVTILLPVL